MGAAFKKVDRLFIVSEMKTCALLVMLIGFVACVKDKGGNPELSYSDRAMLDSCKNTAHGFYRQDTIYPGTNGPHGRFKLRLNHIATTALTDSGRLAIGKRMPDGSMLIKDVYKGGDLDLFAFMYKRNGAWLWGEVKPTGEVVYSVNKDPGVCTSCHSQQGNRDMVRIFAYH